MMSTDVLTMAKEIVAGAAQDSHQQARAQVEGMSHHAVVVALATALVESASATGKKSLQVDHVEARPTCLWTLSSEFTGSDIYESGCGQTWEFLTGGPAENNVRYCHGCGGRVE